MNLFTLYDQNSILGEPLELWLSVCNGKFVHREWKIRTLKSGIVKLKYPCCNFP